MYPVCMAAAAGTVTNATSAGGGFAALVVKILRKRDIAARLAISSKGEGNHGNEQAWNEVQQQFTQNRPTR